jgi:hypothetical protein
MLGVEDRSHGNAAADCVIAFDAERLRSFEFTTLI